MSESGKPSLVGRLIKGGGGVLAVGASLLGIPVIGSLGAVVEKMPLAELEEWVSRMRGRFVTSRHEAGIVSQAAATDPDPADGVGIEKVKLDLPVAQQLPEAEMVSRAKTLVHSEPFTIAMQQAIAKLPEVLSRFMIGTYPARGTDEASWDSGVGVWPTFTLESVARRHFQAQLGRSAAAAESSDVRTLVERGLALDAIEILVEQARQESQAPTDGVRLSNSVTIWSSDEQFAWPNIGDLSSGYVIGCVAKRPFNREHAQAARLELLGELGRREPAALAYLSEAWLRTCAAAEQSREARAAAGSYIDVGLSKLQLSIFDALASIGNASPTERESLLGVLHAAFVALEPIVTILDERPRLDRNLRAVLRAFAQADRETFEQGVKEGRSSLSILGIVRKDPTPENAFEAAFATMARLRNWPLPPPSERNRVPPNASTNA
jgi:hypothetical protein